MSKTFLSVVGLMMASIFLNPPIYAQNFPPEFVARNAASGAGFKLPVGIAFAPNGRIFVVEKRGNVYVIDKGDKIGTPFIDLSSEVLSNEANGLLGVAVDPDFENNRWVYFLYVVDATGGADDDDHAFSRLTRYRAKQGNLNEADLSTRQVLIGKTWKDGIIACGKQHVIGSLRFAQDGTLLISAGESSLPSQVDAGGGHDACFSSGLTNPDEDIGAFRAQYIKSLAGKILRIDKNTGLGLPSNPFYTGNPDDRESRVWCYGLRNPFRFSIRPNGSTDPAAGRPGSVYIGDVGWGQYEEVSVSRSGGENFGWPCHEGPRDVSGYQRANPTHSSCKEIGQSPDNPNDHSLPLIYWHHTDETQSIPSGILGNSVTGGAFYAGSRYPNEYRGYFYADYAQAWIRVLEVDDGDNFVRIRDFADWPGGNEEHGIVDLQSHPETGDMYYVDITRGEVMYIEYTGQLDNQAPIALAKADTLWGDRTIQFSGSGSFDPDGDNISFQWDFGNGASSTSPDPRYTYPAPGDYQVTLTVVDSKGLSDAFLLEVSPGNVPPVVTILSPDNGFGMLPTDRIFLSGTATDESEPESGLDFHWVIDLYHNDHAHPATLEIDGKEGSFVPGEHGDPWDFIYLGVTLEVTNSQGLTGESTHYVVMTVPDEKDITGAGNAISFISNPTGSGNHDIEVIRDGVYPPIGSSDTSTQFDTENGSLPRDEDWIGYEFADVHRFNRLIFQEGLHSSDGGWFESFTVEVRTQGSWHEVFFPAVVPRYGGNNEVSYEIYNLLFSPAEGDAVRVIGKPGGSKDFISIGELRVIETPISEPEERTLTLNPLADSFVWSKTPTDNKGTSEDLRVRETSSASQFAFLKFDLSGLSGAIHGAKLRLFVNDSSPHGGIIYLVSNNYRGSNQPWEELGLNWNNAPAVGGTPIAELGPVVAGSWVEFDVSSIVNDTEIYSFSVRNSNSDAAYYHSNESANPPELLVDIASSSPPPPPPPPPPPSHEPVITSFSPASGPPGTEVLVAGDHLEGTSRVRFGNIDATFQVLGHGELKTQAPENAATDKIEVTTPDGSVKSAQNFVVETEPPPLPAPPEISSFSPDHGEVGKEVTISGRHFSGSIEVTINGESCDFSVQSDTEMLATVPPGASTGKVRVRNSDGSGESASNFVVVIPNTNGSLSFAPTDDAYVRSSSPTRNYGSTSDLRLRKTGSAELAAYLKFNVAGLSAGVGGARLRLQVREASDDGGSLFLAGHSLGDGSGSWTEDNIVWENTPPALGNPIAEAGAIEEGTTVEFDVSSVITGNGVYSFVLKSLSSDVAKYRSSETSQPPELVVFTGDAPAPAPTISSFSPASGPVGTIVAINGAQLGSATSVKFGGATAGQFTIISNTRVVATVPDNATTGKIEVNVAGGTVISSQEFVLETDTTPSPEPPEISSFSPNEGKAGDEITITGKGFSVVTDVSFNGVSADFSLSSDVLILATVPQAASSGKIKIEAVGGTVTSSASFTVQSPGPEPEPEQQTLSLQPIDDSFVRSSRETSNYGDSPELRVRKSSSALFVSYLKFDLTEVGGAIVSARLRLHVADGGPDGGSLYIAGNDWSEENLIWPNSPDLSGAVIVSAGSVEIGEVVEFDVTSVLTANAVYTFAIQSENNDIVVYDSKETGSPPELIVETSQTLAKAESDTADRSRKMVDDRSMAIPDEFSFSPNYPNPFNHETRVSYALPDNSHVTIVVYNLRGQMIRKLVDDFQPAGFKSTAWDGRDEYGNEIGSGLYILRMQAGQRQFTIKATLQK